MISWTNRHHNPAEHEFPLNVIYSYYLYCNTTYSTIWLRHIIIYLVYYEWWLPNTIHFHCLFPPFKQTMFRTRTILLNWLVLFSFWVGRNYSKRFLLHLLWYKDIIIANYSLYFVHIYNVDFCPKIRSKIGYLAIRRDGPSEE